MSKTKLYMVPWIENYKPNHMHCYRSYFLWSRKHQLQRQQRGIYTDLQPMQKQYIGETGRPFIERWKEHLYDDIKVKRPYPVARHFNESDNHRSMPKILSLIKGPANRVTASRKYRESQWISIVKSYENRPNWPHISWNPPTENPSISQPEIFKPSVRVNEKSLVLLIKSWFWFPTDLLNSTQHMIVKAFRIYVIEKSMI